jgi:hypothetical protein
MIVALMVRLVWNGEMTRKPNFMITPHIPSRRASHPNGRASRNTTPLYSRLCLSTVYDSYARTKVLHWHVRSSYRVGAPGRGLLQSA